jgi:hypothetical protein
VLVKFNENRIGSEFTEHCSLVILPSTPLSLPSLSGLQHRWFTAVAVLVDSTATVYCCGVLFPAPAVAPLITLVLPLRPP